MQATRGTERCSNRIKIVILECMLRHCPNVFLAFADMARIRPTTCTAMEGTRLRELFRWVHSEVCLPESG